MNYLVLIEDALTQVLKLSSYSGKKLRRAVEQAVKKNELLDELLGFLKDETIQASLGELPLFAGKNESGLRLVNFHQFKKLIPYLQQETQPDDEIVKYFFSKCDEEERSVYAFILSTPFTKKSVEAPVQEEIEEQAEN